MRRLSFLLAGATVWLFLAAVPVLADGGPHVKDINNGSGAGGLTADSCAGCHRAHTAQGAMLLIEDEEVMCLVCHGAGQGASTDVVNGVQYAAKDKTGGVVGALRNGGFVNARIASGAAYALSYTSGTNIRRLGAVPALGAGDPTTSKHDVGVAGTAWGNGPFSATANPGATVTLECTTCHNPHGNGLFRILRPMPISSTAGGFVLPSTGVSVTDYYSATNETKNYTIHQPITPIGARWTLLSQLSGTTESSGDYFHRKIPWNSTASSSSTGTWDAPNGQLATFNGQITAWCATCHTRLTTSDLNQGDLQPAPYENSSGDAIFKYRHPTTSNKPCTTCHVAHGSNADMNAAVASEELVPGMPTYGDMASSFLLKVDNRGTCQVCHDPTNPTAGGVTFGPAAPAVP